MHEPAAHKISDLHRAIAGKRWLLAAYLAAEVLRIEPGNASAWMALCEAAIALQQRPAAERFAQIAVAALSSAADREDDVERLLRQVKQMPDEPAPAAGPRYLLIRDWGAGFWTDVDHVISQLLVADATGRQPVVYWGETSKYYPHGFSGNAWNQYFEPVSDLSMETLVEQAPELTIAPHKWNAHNLAGPVRNRWNGEGSRFSAILALGCRENVVVADFHTSSSLIALWVPPTTPLMNLGYSETIRRHIHLRPEIIARIHALRASWGPGPVVAMHYRGTDKPAENSAIIALNHAIEADALRRAADLDARVFLITDSERTRARMAALLGNRLITTDAIRSDASEGLHMQGTHDPRRLALDVVADTYLAASCDEFFGSTQSNVACMISHLWPKGPATLKMWGGVPVSAQPNAFAMTFERPD